MTPVYLIYVRMYVFVQNRQQNCRVYLPSMHQFFLESQFAQTANADTIDSTTPKITTNTNTGTTPRLGIQTSQGQQRHRFNKHQNKTKKAK